ncbi:serine hydrolase domain-containing protein [Sphaerisporangium dianthi]|uniref:Serine hydrolase domain-containing protein n=1 Tax=Sphaerisporangium dianthi TaxID=1436120 RepID=A0ABV9C807_9ACTN
MHRPRVRARPRAVGPQGAGARGRRDARRARQADTGVAVSTGHPRVTPGRHAHAGLLAALYAPDPLTGRAVPARDIGDRALRPPEVMSAVGGMLSTLSDYVRFTRMLAGGGELDGVRVLAPRTLRLMTADHLGADLATLSTGGFPQTSLDGVGFGLGFAVVTNPLKSHSVSSAGEYYWGGAAGTVFWVAPVEDLTVVFMTQPLPLRGSLLAPSEAYPLRRQLHRLVCTSLTT